MNYIYVNIIPLGLLTNENVKEIVIFRLNICEIIGKYLGIPITVSKPSITVSKPLYVNEQAYLLLRACSEPLPLIGQGVMAEKKKIPRLRGLSPEEAKQHERERKKVWAKDQHTVKFNKEVWEKWSEIKLRIKAKTNNEVAIELMKLW